MSYNNMPRNQLIKELKKAQSKIAVLENSFRREHAQGEEVLSQSDRKYQVIFENAVIGIFQTTLCGRFVLANHKMATLFGYASAEELIESVKNAGEELFVDPKERNRLIHNISKIEGFIYYEVEYLRKNGDIFLGAVNSRGVHNNEGTLIYIEGFVEDITKHRAADVALAEQIEFTQNLIHGSAAPTFVVDCNHKVIIWNKACEEFTGIKNEEIIGTNDHWKPFYSYKRPALADIVVDGNYDNLHPPYDTLLKSKFIVDGLQSEGWFPKVNGKERYVSFNAAPIRKSNGQILAAIQTFEDITEMKRAENELMESEKRHRCLFDYSPTAMLMIDPDMMTVVDANVAAVSFYGYSKENFIGKSMADIIVMPKELISESLKSAKSGSQCIQLLHRLANGDIRNVELCRGPITINDKTYLFSTINDITERKSIENQLKHVQKMEAIGVLAGGIAHDFNNILTVIIGYASLLSLSIGKESPFLRNLNSILDATERATRLTQSLLSFSRKKPIETKPVNLNDIVLGTRNLLSRLLREDIEFKTTSTEEHLMIMADVHEIEQVLINLITNARDALVGGGSLKMSTSIVNMDMEFIKVNGYGDPGKYAMLTCIDNGHGMDKATVNRIFEPFFTTKTVDKGTGLGLAVAYGIITQHNGYINCRSEPGSGTTFQIYLPLTDTEPVEKSAAAEFLPKFGTETILLAEDNTTARELTQEVLETYGYTVVPAIDGEDAINKFAQHKDKIHMIILDVIMPKRNGKEACEIIKSIKPDVKCLFISGYSADIFDDAEIERLEFLPKPILPHVFLDKIREMLDK